MGLLSSDQFVRILNDKKVIRKSIDAFVKDKMISIYDKVTGFEDRNLVDVIYFSFRRLLPLSHITFP